MNITVDEAHIKSGVPRSTIRRWAASGKIVAFKFGKTWVIDEDSLTGDSRVERHIIVIEENARLRKVLDRLLNHTNYALWLNGVRGYYVSFEQRREMEAALRDDQPRTNGADQQAQLGPRDGDVSLPLLPSSSGRGQRVEDREEVTTEVSGSIT